MDDVSAAVHKLSDSLRFDPPSRSYLLTYQQSILRNIVQTSNWIVVFNSNSISGDLMALRRHRDAQALPS